MFRIPAKTAAKSFFVQTIERIGLFFPIVIIPSQWPRFFNKARSGILLICLSLNRRIYRNKQKKRLFL
jgi:hypothetical protein